MQKLRVASRQLPVTQDVDRNAEYVGRYMEKASAASAHLLHTSEACLSGYAGADFTSFTDFDWERLRWNTACLRDMAAALNLWLVLGSAHFLSARSKPTNRPSRGYRQSLRQEPCAWVEISSTTQLATA